VKSYTEASHGVGWFIRKSFLLAVLSFYPQPSCVKLHLADMRTLRPVRSVIAESYSKTGMRRSLLNQQHTNQLADFRGVSLRWHFGVNRRGYGMRRNSPKSSEEVRSNPAA
jgi:hypothetical protein